VLGADDVIGKSWQVSTPIHDEDIVTIEKDPGSSRASLQRFSFNAVLATCVWITVIMCFVDLLSLQSHGYGRSDIGTCGTTLQN
jgi:hypothetical protein